MSNSPEATDEGPGDVTAGVSEFIARVLGQLSLSAWLPAALLTLASASLLQFRLQGAISLSEALGQAQKAGWALALLTVPILILATLVTQAFSFEAIRILEGYWRRPGPPSWLRSGLIRYQVGRKKRLGSKRIKASVKAFSSARPRLILGKTDPAVIHALECKAIGATNPSAESMTDEQKGSLKALEWWYLCDAHLLARVDLLRAMEREYPRRDSRILPTRLGNVIRATEDGLKRAGDDLEGFALRARPLVSSRVRSQHDQFRTRLDMYCILVFVSAVLTGLSPLLLWPIWVKSHDLWVAAITSLFALLAASSYYAAIASAKGYAAALRQMDAALATKPTAVDGAVGAPRALASGSSQR